MNEMKMSGPLIQNDASLEWDDFIPVASNIPQDVFYQATSANSYNSGGFSFYVLSPATNSLMSNEAVIEYQLQIDSGNALALSQSFENVAGVNGSGGLGANPYTTVLSAQNGRKLALRQCWPICRAMQNISLNINGTVISGQPEMWMDALNRLYLSEEEAATICTLSGGEFDSGCRAVVLDTDNTFTFGNAGGGAPNASLTGYLYPGYSNQVAAAGQNVLVGYSAFPNDENYYNKGFSKRFHRLALINRAGSSLTGGTYGSGTVNAQTNYIPTTNPSTARFVDGSTDNAGVGGGFYVTVYERIPICPFLMYDSRDSKVSIPNVRVLNLNVQMDSNYSKLILQGAVKQTANTGLTAYTTFEAANLAPIANFYNKAPILHLRWYMTSIPIPESVSIPAWIVRENLSTTGMSIAANGFTATSPYLQISNVSYSSVNFEGIPDLLLVYGMRLPSDSKYWDPSDHNLEITSLNITVAGVSGKVLQMSSGELYKTWLENIYHKGENKSDYQTWRKKNCVAALRPKDYGALFGPGFNYPIQMSFTVNFYDWWNIPSIQALSSIGIDVSANAINYGLYVIAFYQRYVLELNASGGSRLDLLKVPIHQLKIGQAPNSLLERAPQ